MRARWTIAAAFLSACGGGGDDEFSCSDPKYGNGTCDLDTACSAPDIDCFVTRLVALYLEVVDQP